MCIKTRPWYQNPKKFTCASKTVVVFIRDMRPMLWKMVSNGGIAGFQVGQTWVRILVQPLCNCVALGKTHNFSFVN